MDNNKGGSVQDVTTQDGLNNVVEALANRGVKAVPPLPDIQWQPQTGRHVIRVGQGEYTAEEYVDLMCPAAKAALAARLVTQGYAEQQIKDMHKGLDNREKMVTLAMGVSLGVLGTAGLRLFWDFLKWVFEMKAQSQSQEKKV